MRLGLISYLLLFACLLMSVESKGRGGRKGGRRRTRPRNYMKEREQAKMAMNREAAASVNVRNKMIEELFQFYKTNIRPKRNQSEPVLVKIGVSLIQIMEVNMRKFNMQVYMWVTLEWTDEFLGWDPTIYGLEKLLVKPENLWRPDLFVYNSLTMDKEESERAMEGRIVARNIMNEPGFINGSETEEYSSLEDDYLVEEEEEAEGSQTNSSSEEYMIYPWVADAKFAYPLQIQFSCLFNGKDFPFDTQNCSIFFGFWSQDLSLVDLWPSSPSGFLEEYSRNEEWDLVDVTLNRKIKYFRGVEEPFSLVRMDIVMRRNPLFYVMNLVVPSLVITEVAIVGSFTVASSGEDRSEKVNLGLATLLAMAIMMLLVADLIPTTDMYFPRIGWFFLGIILIISLCTLFSSVIIHIQRRGRFGWRLSHRTRRLFFCKLARYLWMSVPDCIIPPNINAVLKEVRTKAHLQNLLKTAMNNGAIANGPVSQPLFRSCLSVPANTKLCRTDSDLSFRTCVSGAGPDPQLLEQLQKIHTSLDEVKNLLMSKEEEGLVKMEWEFFTDIIDRFLLIFFTLLLAFFTALTLSI